MKQSKRFPRQTLRNQLSDEPKWFFGILIGVSLFGFGWSKLRFLVKSQTRQKWRQRLHFRSFPNRFFRFDFAWWFFVPFGFFSGSCGILPRLTSFESTVELFECSSQQLCKWVVLTSSFCLVICNYAKWGEMPLVWRTTSICKSVGESYANEVPQPIDSTL